jgi:hypothetical protein
MRGRMDKYMGYVYLRIVEMLELRIRHNTNSWLMACCKEGPGWPGVGAILSVEDVEGLGVKVKRAGFMEAAVGGKLLKEAREEGGVGYSTSGGQGSVGRSALRWARAVQGLRKSLGCNSAGGEGYFRLAYGLIRMLEWGGGDDDGSSLVEAAARRVWEGMQCVIERHEMGYETGVVEEERGGEEVGGEAEREGRAEAGIGAEPTESEFGYYAPPQHPTEVDSGGSNSGDNDSGTMYYNEIGGGTYGGGAYDEFYDDPYDDIATGEEDADGDLEDIASPSMFLHDPPPPEGLREGFEEYLELARRAAEGDREGVALGLNVLGSCLMSLWRLGALGGPSPSPLLSAASAAYSLASDLAGFGSGGAGGRVRRSSHQYDLGSSLVGSTSAESACRRAEALLLLAERGGKGREDRVKEAEGILEGLCGYLNLQGHIGSNVNKGLEDEVNRIGELLKAADKVAVRFKAVNFSGRKSIKGSTRFSAMVGVSPGVNGSLGFVCLATLSGSGGCDGRVYSHLPGEQMYMVKGRFSHPSPPAVLGRGGMVVCEDGEVLDFSRGNGGESRGSVGGKVERGSPSCWSGGGEDGRGHFCVVSESRVLLFDFRPSAQVGPALFELDVPGGASEVLDVRCTVSEGGGAKLSCLLLGGGGDVQVLSIDADETNTTLLGSDLTEFQVKRGSFSPTGGLLLTSTDGRAAVVSGSGELFTMLPPDSLPLDLGSGVLLPSPPLSRCPDGWFHIGSSVSITFLPSSPSASVEVKSFHYETLEGEREGAVIGGVILGADQGLGGHIIVGDDKEIDVVSFEATFA